MQIIDWKQLSEEVGIPYSRQHVLRLEKAGQFPKRVQLGLNRVGWVKAEVEAWLEDKLKNR